jgi:hypothetical protein
MRHLGFGKTDVKQETLAARFAPDSFGAALYPQLTFESDALMLGAGAKLACAKRSSAAPIDEPRLEAVLAVAYGRPIDKLPLAHPRRAVEKMREGDVASALMHLALTGLGKLSQPKEAAWRLLAAEGLMGSGVEPHMILRAFALNGPPDGRWTSQDFGVAFFRCVQHCMEEQDWPEWRKHFANNQLLEALAGLCTPWRCEQVCG